MPTPQTHAEAAARVAAIVRALPDTALCTLLDIAQAAYDDAELYDWAQDEADFAAIEAALEAATPAV